MPQRLSRILPAPAPGIVHLGLGAFARAHVALYVARAVAASGGDWGITGVSLRSPNMRDRLAPQDYSYTALELGTGGDTWQQVDVLNDVLVAPEDPGRVLAALENCRMVTLTITEKGYCHDPATGRLDLSHPDIRADLADSGRPVSAIGYLVRALAERRTRGTAPFAVCSCDNLPGNGKFLQAMVCDLAGHIDLDLAEWIGTAVRFPSSMVDRIVPAVTDTDLARVATMTGVADAAPVLHEPFSQWVLEDDFAPGARPDLAAAGVTLVADVAPWEHMKLRMLNAAHSSLAYLGYLAGCKTIAEAASRSALEHYLRSLWTHEIIPTLTAPPGVDLHAYAEELLLRFQNPAIHHRCAQVAMDGSKKLPVRLLGTFSDLRAMQRVPDALATAIAAWMCYASGKDLEARHIEVSDPLAADLEAYGASRDPVTAFLADDRIFPKAFRSDSEAVNAIVVAHNRLTLGGIEKALAPWNSSKL